MSKNYRKKSSRSKRKGVAPKGRVESFDGESIQLCLPMAEVLAGVKDELESMIGAAGLLVISALLEDEVEQKVGWFRHLLLQTSHKSLLYSK